MTRDPARIERMLRRLLFQWSKCPDLRLGQMLVGAHQQKYGGVDLFYIEDDALLDAVDAYFERGQFRTGRKNHDRQGDGG